MLKNKELATDSYLDRQLNMLKNGSVGQLAIRHGHMMSMSQSSALGNSRNS